ncbi:TetR/AcrR family transcriptional regulator [Leucobacter sp. 7(1)]|uniref:TetR/AcrR family transcriptional regulator n=1 Tax=Leucobacter sp. 7(1) TaxID=1255613 RepID=UPI000B36151D|nr:TetR/AcrR family transcriptional regulator [Leucobacter sp. 7(1)]
MTGSRAIDGRRARGDATRRVVLAEATQLVSVQGLDGLTIGALAERSGHRKSSIATLFGGKEGLQLATVTAARTVFVSAVIEPARAHPRGTKRLAELLANVLEYSRDRVFAGGCFFAATAADVDSKPGAVNDAVRAVLQEWYGYVEAQIRHAVAAEELAVPEPQQARLAFHLIALEEQANSRSLLFADPVPYAFAAGASADLLAAAGALPAALERLRALAEGRAQA